MDVQKSSVISEWTSFRGPRACYGDPEFDMKSAVQLVFQTDYNTASELEVEVFDVRFIE